jgi:SAM-dependent methyltransferase
MPASTKVKTFSGDASLVEEVNCAFCKSDQKQTVLEKNLLRIVICNKCGLWYTDRRWNAEGIRRYYQEAYFTGGVDGAFKNYIGETEEKLIDFKLKYQQLKPFKEFGTLLDVGCATGVSLLAAAELGYEPEGLEPSEWAVKNNPTSFTIHNTLLTDFQTSNTYDVISMWDVIEHFSDPDAVFQKLNDLLKPNGLVIFTYPNPSSWPAKLMGKRWWVLVPDEHLFFYPESLLIEWIGRFGFRCVSQPNEARYLTLGKLMQKLMPPFEGLLKAFRMDKRIIKITLPYKNSAIFQKV